MDYARGWDTGKETRILFFSFLNVQLIVHVACHHIWSYL